jgi:predicted nucleic acid-binding protein
MEDERMIGSHQLESAVFIDKSALTAYMDPDNPNYHKASSFFLELDDLDRTFITTNQIIFSVNQWLRDNFGYIYADYFLNIIDKSVQKEKLWIIAGNSELENKARQFLLQCSEYEITLEEALNAIVITDYQLHRIFTFNKKYAFLSKMNEHIKVIPSSLW